MGFNLLDTIEQGGCSAKLSAEELHAALIGLEYPKNDLLLVDIDTHDDGGVYQISNDRALIQTTDFFPPVCSDPYEFGQIAAANALSDVYAMGGQVLTAMNLLLFPAHLPMDILREILNGGHNKVAEAGGVIIGGHTVADDIPKYGLAVTGEVHPKKVVSNANAQEGDVLVLSKPIGTGVLVSAMKNAIGTQDSYEEALKYMKMLNRKGAEIMQNYGIKSATDVTGFGLLGHAHKMAKASRLSFEFFADSVPAIKGVDSLLEMGCIPGASFRNLDFCGDNVHFDDSLPYETKMLFADAQSSGGLLMCVKEKDVENVVRGLKNEGYEDSAAIGVVLTQDAKISVFVK